MGTHFSKVVPTAIILLSLFYLCPSCFSQNYFCTYQLQDSPDGSAFYSLNVGVTESLYEYYTEKDHRLRSDHDFAAFVTPYALQPIADSLTEIYGNDEDLTNGVLMIVHQIPYNETLPSKYPVETIVQNRGDCDLFSYVAASILTSARLDVVLLYYEEEAHMNIGVHLSQPPQDAREQVYYVTYNGIQYYVAECTGGDWRNGWRVGECPQNLKESSPEALSLEGCEQWAPGQVSSSYQTLAQSTISLTASSAFATQGSDIILSGQLTPHLQGETIMIYVKTNNLPWTALEAVTTRNEGRFEYAWRTEVAGICYIRASWSGNSNYAGTDSPILNIIVLSSLLIILIVITVAILVLGTIAFLASRRYPQEIQEPLPPEVPSYTGKAFTPDL
ncbi:MAG: hypothetical protein ACFE7R_08505 [Candidatus Hodarchaeota archaeon]